MKASFAALMCAVILASCAPTVIPAGDALRQAERDGMASGLRASVWGAFTLVGDPSVKLALRKH